MPQIDRPGVFTGTIVESTLGQTAKGYPQWVARLLAEKKYVTEKDELAHFNITEPAYVDWAFDESLVAYMVLFNDNGPLKNYDQLIAATGWTGQDFQDLTNLVGKKILFRVESEEYNGKNQLKVVWVDAEDAPPERSLKPAAPDVVKNLNAKFLAGMKKPVAPAKPAAAKASVPANPTQPAPSAGVPSAAAQPKPASPNAGEVPNAGPAAPAAASSTSPVAAAAAGKATPPAKKTKAPPAATSNPAPGLPEETTKDAAWEYLNDPAVRGQNDEGVIAEAWIAACQEVGPDKDESTFTGKDWASVRNLVIRDVLK